MPYPSPTVTRHVRRVLAARPEAVADARHAVRALPVDEVARGTLELLISELVTNAVLHAGMGPEDPISVHITSRGDRVRLAVRDSGPGFSGSRADGADELAPGGRGCVIVDAMADSWGVERDSGGCMVWCELTVAERPRDVADRAVTDAYIGRLAMQAVVAAPLAR